MKPEEVYKVARKIPDISEAQAYEFARMITRADKAVTKEDLDLALADLRSEMATKEDLRSLEERMTALRSEMATKEDLRSLEERMTALRSEMATKEDLRSLKQEMKEEIGSLEERMTTYVNTQLSAQLYKHTLFTVFSTVALLESLRLLFA